MENPLPHGRIAVVTDSTASLPPEMAAASGVTVVPLDVIIDGVAGREGIDVGPGELVAALERGAGVRTSQPSPEEFIRAYARAVAAGATEIVSVHLSSELSGTVASAELAAHSATVPVHVVDSRTVALGLGLAVRAAARAAARGADARTVAELALRRSLDSRVAFTVATLEHLRRGGRLGATAAAVGTVLGLRPLLAVLGGRIVVTERIRTTARARKRLESWAIEEADRRGQVELAVHYLGDPEPARSLADRLRARFAATAVEVVVAEVSAVVGAHAGPGVLGVVVADTDAADAL
jgi:DegV family protein with EDD domain